MADKQLYQIHGWLLWFAFGLAFPLGIIVSKYFQKRLRKHWFHLHWTFQVSGVAATIAGVIIGLVKFNAFWNTLHSKLGFVLFIVILVQYILGLSRPRTYSRTRAAWFFLHWLLGTGSVIVGWITIYKGLHIYEDGFGTDLKVFYIVFLSQISVLGFVYLLLDRWDHVWFQTLG